MKTFVLYHSADFDGIFSREIARKHFGKTATYVGWDYGQPTPDVAGADEFYMIDLAVPELMNHPNLIWIDHHASAIAQFSPEIKGYRIDGVAACRLAWQWFNNEYSPQNPYCHVVNWNLPVKEDFIARVVKEPTSVRLAGEYDIWDKRDPAAELLQHGLKSQALSQDGWKGLLDTTGDSGLVYQLLNQGRVVQYAKTQENNEVIAAYGFTFQWEGLTFLACNHARFNSHLFAAGIKPEHDALFGFNWTGQQWRVSLYGVPGKPDIDLAKIAVKHGGGGHKQACGFRSDTLPFLKA